MNNSPNRTSFKTMLIVMLAIYSIFFNTMWQSGSFLGFDLFHYIRRPAQVTRYSLRFVDINGQSVDEPVYLDSPNEWIDESVRYDALDVVNRIGIALYAGDVEQANLLHSELIDTYFVGINSASYDLVLRVVNPVEKYALEDEPVVDQLIQSFEFQRIVSAN